MATVTITFDNNAIVYETDVTVSSTDVSPSKNTEKSNVVQKRKVIPKKRKISEAFNSKFYLPYCEHDLIQRYIFATHNYFEQGFLDKTKDYLPLKPTIIDIGANIGNHTLYWANELKAKKIYSFEPVKDTFKILEKNIKINNLEKVVKLYNVGLSDQEADGAIKSYDPNNIGGTRLKLAEDDTVEKIPLITLDSLDFKDKKIDLIKIDVEGMDYMVLTGAINTIKKYKPIILMESFPNEYNISSRILKALGYKKELELDSFEYLFVYDK